ncbi:hypothetical protein ACTJKE_36505 [Ensifer sp. 22521]|uniref:hypothetical protein n=1 Tax=Ensifer sp. 22521 TaxID=3453935 RepID=UPI003F8431B5
MAVVRPSRAEKRLLLDAEKAENFGHKGLKGNERAAALKGFLEEHLPAIFAVGSGEAIDFVIIAQANLTCSSMIGQPPSP